MAKGWRRRAAARAAATQAACVAEGETAPFREAAESTNTAWHVAGLPARETPTLSIILGTYNRLGQLQRCLTESRKSVGELSYEFIICDGGSTDGSREWLAKQSDVILIGDRILDGAVTAYNRAFLGVRGNFVALLNDDCAPTKTALYEAVAVLQASSHIGQVAIPFSRQGQRQLAAHRGQPAASYCVMRVETARAVATVCGGIWNPIYHTYAADWELSCLIHELGWGIATLPHVGVLDFGRETQDELRARNRIGRKQDSNTFYARWPRTGHPNLDEVTTRRIAQHGRRTSSKQTAIAQCDPKPGEMPPRDPTTLKERVLHLHLSSPSNGQESQVRALTALGSGDYVRVPVHDAKVWRLAKEAAEQLQPSIAFVQAQEPRFTSKFFHELREAARNPNLVICNWSGDVGSHNAPNPNAMQWAIEAAPEVDLTLWSSFTHVEVLRNVGVPAAYLQIGYDEEYFFEPADGSPFQFDVAFLFHEHYPKLRASLGTHDDCGSRTKAGLALQKAFKHSIVGAIPASLAETGDVYRQTRLAVSISASCTLDRYTSDRLFRAMACAATAVKRFTGWESFGLKHEENCLLFDSTEELVALAHRWTHPKQEAALRAIRSAGAKLMRKHHTWDVRMQELRPLIAAVRSAR